MSLPRYPRYKDSGVEWLGQLPEHWAVRRLKRACRVFPSNVDKKSHDGETPVVLCNYTDVYYNDVITADLPFMSATASEAQIEKFALQAGDTIITKDSETADDIAISAYVPADLPGVVCGYHLSIVRPQDGAHGAFVKRLFDSVYARAKFATLAKGLTRVGLGQYELDNVELPFPPLDEQRLVAAFLDRETAKIDALIAEQQRLMELLQEKRQAVISHAVTKGLNPDAPMKPSGVEWLGDVPAHWEVKKMKHLIEVLTDYTANGSFASLAQNVTYLSVGYSRLVRLTDLREGLANDGVFVDASAHAFLSKSELFGGEVLLANVGAYAGYACLMPSTSERATLGPNMYLIRFRESMLSNAFGLLCLMSVSVQEQLALASTSTAQPKLNKEDVRQCVTAIPPTLSEQTQILAFVTSESRRFDSLICETRRSIDLLQGRRSALITAAVTGQIDVRTCAA